MTHAKWTAGPASPINPFLDTVSACLEKRNFVLRGEKGKRCFISFSLPPSHIDIIYCRNYDYNKRAFRCRLLFAVCFTTLSVNVFARALFRPLKREREKVYPLFSGGICDQWQHGAKTVFFLSRRAQPLATVTCVCTSCDLQNTFFSCNLFCAF